MPKGATPESMEICRIFKKSSLSGKVTVFLGKRDFLDYLTHVDAIDGVVLVDPECVKDQKKVYVQVLGAFRYGREDLDIIGLSFRKDLFSATIQVYPPVVEQQKPLTALQERLITILGPNAYPFFFEIPPNTPSSVTLQQTPGEDGKPCGVDYQLKTHLAESLDAKAEKLSTVRMAIRKLTYAPNDVRAPPPKAEINKNGIKLEASLEKEKYYHGESVAAQISIDNTSSKTIKKIKLSVVQKTMVTLHVLCEEEQELRFPDQNFQEGFPIRAGQTGFFKTYHMMPLLENNRDKRGLALDGKLKHEDTNLACSTKMSESLQKENAGIIVSYKVVIKLIFGFGTSDLILELPFTLTHPMPEHASRTTSCRESLGDDAVFNSDEMVEDDLVFQEFNRAPIAKPECFKETETSEEKNDE
ncbi:beta-arrestin-1-like isoform X2 [Ostrea edulis]|uniref:beta-arrestin-1-like isoform X2 n=1 Tax=Ostrea edulis TaxID=37623 RepID=UPI0020964274|nr:beta-arrestin-1-like isoform X2 [Ostrea edulis]